MRCKMAISQLQYAAQVVDKEGNHYKFDDIGCMLVYVRQRHLKTTELTFFFTDYMNTAHWLDATSAVFVKSRRIDSPMASGFAAFDGEPSAKDFAANNQGQVLSVVEVLESGVPDSNSVPEAVKRYTRPTSTPQ